MTDPTRHDATPERPAAAGDVRIDALLTEGLEHYFAGRFEHAIHVWTRVMFVDRHHASARAYIERARGALAERQRRAEESLQRVGQLLDEGRAREARQTLSDCVAFSGEDERTAALRVRLERLERVAGGGPRIHAVAPSAAAWGATAWAWANQRVKARHVVMAALVVVGLVAATSPGIRALFGLTYGPAGPVAVSPAAEVPVLTAADVALTRAQALYTRGRLAEALTVLDRVGAEQAGRAEADRLRVEIQRVLLASADERTARGAR